MNKKNFLTIILLLLLTACSNTQLETNNSVSLDVADCNFGKYNMDCDIVKFLESDLAWTNEKGGQAFCAYELVGKIDDLYYLQALCEEYYIQDEKIICPSEEARQACFMAKDEARKACQEECETETVEDYLSQGSGVSIPVKVSKTEVGFSLWQPRDGSLYAQDLAENFPENFADKLKNVDGGLLQSIVIARAEKFFETEVYFEVAGDMNQECASYEDCGMLPFDYAIRSNCPHTVKCLDGKCVAGCYDSFDYTKFPMLK